MRLTVLLPLAFVLSIPLAGAQQAEEDTGWRLEARDLDVRGHANGFGFTSARDSDLGADSLSGAFDAGAAHLMATFAATEPELAAVRIDVTWSSLVEYRDADGDGRYGLADETVQAVAIPVLPQQTLVTPLLAGGHTATVTYTLPENASDPEPVVGGGLPGTRGSLRLAFALVEASSTVGGRLVVPTEIGLTAEVRGFPFQAGDTRLALMARVTTDATALELREAGVAAADGRHSLLAAWASLAEADGRAAEAGWSSLSSDASQATAVLSLPRGDPVAQEGSISAHRLRADVAETLRDLPPGDWRVYALGLAGAFVALGLPSLRRLKER